MPLVRAARPGRKPVGDVAGGHEPGSRGLGGSCDVQPDVRDVHTADEVGAIAQEQARLVGGERDRHGGVQRVAGRGAGAAGDPRRDVDGEHGGVVVRGRGRGPGSSEAGTEGGVDDEVGGREDRRELLGVEHRHLHATSSESAGGGSSVVAVVALAGDHHDAAAVGTPQQVERDPCDRGAGPPDQDVDRLRRGCVDLGHLCGGEDGEHATSLPHRRGPLRSTDAGRAPTRPTGPPAVAGSCRRRRSCRSGQGPTSTPPTSVQPEGSAAGVPTIPDETTPVRSAPERSVPVRSVPVSCAPVRSASMSFAL